jgi:hypothetical protein
MYVPDPKHQFVTSGGPVTIVRHAAGRYSVFFPGIAADQGVAHVTAVNDQPVWCQLGGYGPTSLGERVDVICTELGGRFQDNRFAVVFSTSTAPPAGPGAYAYLQATAAGGLLDSYNSGAAPNLLSHAGVGLYSVTLSGLSTPTLAGGLQVTAVNARVSARCKVGSWRPSGAGQGARILCFDAAGAPADSGFTLSFQLRRAITGGFFPPSRFGYLYDTTLFPAGPPLETNFNSLVGPGANTPVVPGALDRFPSIGALPDHAQATAVSADPNWCILTAPWITNTNPPDAFVQVRCFDPAGATIVNPVLVTYTSSV